MIIEREREREREHAREFYSKNPTPNGSRPRGLIGLYRKGQKNKNKRPQPAKESSREAFIQEGNRTPVAKATHARYRVKRETEHLWRKGGSYALEVTVTSLHPPHLCRIAVFSIFGFY